MNRKLRDWAGSIVRATDGDVGTVEQFYFDDLTWIVRYIAVNTGEALACRRVLISLAALVKPDWAKRVFPINLTMEQVRCSPMMSIDAPISPQHEIELHAYYDWPTYWGGGFYLPLGYAMGMDPATEVEVRTETLSSEVRKLDPHLRCTRDVAGCHVHATDGNIGHVEDFLVEEGKWPIRYFVVNTRNWLPGRRVLVSPQWIKKVDWDEKTVFVDLTRDAVRKSPKVDPTKPVIPAYEGKLCAHLQKPEAAEWVVFKFDAPPGAAVYLAGTFNNWDSTSIRLGENHKGTYTATVLLAPGRYEYKFIVNGEWLNDTDSSEHTPNAFGTANSVLAVTRNAPVDVHLHTFARSARGEGRPLCSRPVGG